MVFRFISYFAPVYKIVTCLQSLISYNPRLNGMFGFFYTKFFGWKEEFITEHFEQYIRFFLQQVLLGSKGELLTKYIVHAILRFEQ